MSLCECVCSSLCLGEREREGKRGGAWMGFGARAIHVLFRREEILSLQNFEETPYHY